MNVFKEQGARSKLGVLEEFNCGAADTEKKKDSIVSEKAELKRESS